MKVECTRLNILILTMMFFTVNTASAKVFKKAEPAAKNTDFVEGSMMRKDPHLPFNKAWKAQNFDKRDYSEIYVAPVNTEYLRQNSFWGELSIKDVEDDVNELAANMRSTVRRAFWDDTNGRFKIVSKPGPKTLILEIAITELIPNKAGFEVLSMAAGPAGGLAASAGSAVAKSIGSKSIIAIEARIRDGADGGIVAMFADRESEKGNIVSIKNFSWYGHVNVIIDEWAQQLVKIANKSPDDIVSDSPTFSFKPW